MSNFEKLKENLKFFSTIIYLIIFRDLSALFLLLKLLVRVKWTLLTNQVVVNLFDNVVKRHCNKTAIIYQNKNYKFHEINDLANRISYWFENHLNLYLDDEYEKKQQQQSTDNGENEKADALNYVRNHQNTIKIGLMFTNIPEFASFLIGIARVRCSSVFFNHNHRNEMLLNAFNSSKCKLFIFEPQFLSSIKEIADKLPEDLRFIIYDRNKRDENVDNFDKNLIYKGFTRDDLINNNIKDIDENFSKILDQYPITKVKKNYPYKINDIVSYIFTSGTTGGKIKAAALSNFRYISAFYMVKSACDIKIDDNIYVCLPLYHVLGGIMGMGGSLIFGHSVTLVSKFSASKFWKDCYENQCTGSLYLGELCRILLSRPVDEYEKKHKIYKFFGAGLNKMIWSKFVERFRIKNVYEYYGSTEGNVVIVNLMQVPGACGFIPYYFGRIMRLFYPIHFLKVDDETQELVRGPDGFCIEAKPGETGMLVGEIKKNVQFSHFIGYSSVEDSSKKIVKNIHREGDFAFVSGDLMEMDHYGNFYFKDRTGDTFRWKGENVSTTEIETIISKFINHKDCIVYGIKLPHYDGNCGMAAIVEDNIDLNSLYEYMKKNTPEYSIPKFIRIAKEIPKTITYKYIKYTFRNDGIDLNKLDKDSNEKIYYFNQNNKKYELLTEDIYQKILKGLLKF